MGTCLLLVNGAQVEGGGGAKGEVSTCVNGPSGAKEEASIVKALAGLVDVVHGNACIKVIAVIGRAIVEDTGVHVEVAFLVDLVVEGVVGGVCPGTICIEFVAEIEFGAIEAAVGISALEANGELVVAVFIEAFVVGGGSGEIVLFEDAIGLLIAEDEESDTEIIVFWQVVFEDTCVECDGAGGESVVDGGPLVAVVSGNAEVAIKFAGKGRVEGKRGRKKLRKMRILCAHNGHNANKQQR